MLLKYTSSTMLLALICLVSAACAKRIKEDFSQPPRDLARLALKAVKEIPKQSGLLGSRVSPAIPSTKAIPRTKATLQQQQMQSSLFHAAKAPWAQRIRAGPADLSRTPKSRQFHSRPSPNRRWPPLGFEVGRTVRMVVTNEEVVIIGFYDKESQDDGGTIECWNLQDDVPKVLHLQPGELSLVLRKRYIAPEKREEYKLFLEQQEQQHEYNGETFKHGDKVIVMATGQRGRVGMPAPVSDVMRIDFLTVGKESSGLYYHSELNRLHSHP